MNQIYFKIFRKSIDILSLIAYNKDNKRKELNKI